MTAQDTESSFTLRLDNFEGPFDLLLQLIAKHQLDITEVALSKVTDEFIAHVRAAGPVWDLEQTSQFVLVAATLLDLKAARLVPSGEVEDVEDLALLEARDLLFARLLQYRAFKEVAAWLGERWDVEAGHLARPGGMEEAFTGLQPEVELVPLQRFAKIAARALTPKQAAEISLTHLHAPNVSVQEEGRTVARRLRTAGRLTFAELTDDADRLTTVCRFLALLELFRERAVTFEQDAALGSLHVVWTGNQDEVEITDEFDRPAGVETEASDQTQEQP